MSDTRRVIHEHRLVVDDSETEAVMEETDKSCDRIQEKQRAIRLQARDVELSMHRGLAIAETYFRVMEKAGREINPAVRDMINNVQMIISLLATAIASAKSLKMAVAATGIGLLAIAGGEAYNYFSENPINWGASDAQREAERQRQVAEQYGGAAAEETPREEAQRERRERYEEGA